MTPLFRRFTVPPPPPDPALAALGRARLVRYLLVPAGAIPDPRWRAWCRDVGLPCVRAVVAEGRVAADWMHLAWRAGDLDRRRLVAAVLPTAGVTAHRMSWPDRSSVLIDGLDPAEVEPAAWHLAEWLGACIEAAGGECHGRGRP
jgi:hypothetical protein